MVEPLIDFPRSQTLRGHMCVGKALNLLYQPVLDSCLCHSDHILSIDEVSGDSHGQQTLQDTPQGNILCFKHVYYVSIGTFKD